MFDTQELSFSWAALVQGPSSLLKKGARSEDHLNYPQTPEASLLVQVRLK